MNSTRRLAFFGVALILVFKTHALQIADQNFLPGIRTGSNDIPYQNVPPCDGTRLTACASCQTIKVCLSLTESNNPIHPCPMDTPYCDSFKGACSAIPDDSVAACSTVGPANPSTTFYCTGKGIYPDPYSCLTYYYCEEGGIVGDRYQCPPGYRYNSKFQLCQRIANHNRPEACKALSCDESGTVFRAYPSDTKYYYYCQYDTNDATKPPRILVDACDEGASFDPTGRKCVFRCLREGMFAKSSDRNKYYQCYRASNRKLVYIERVCPIPAQVFDDVLKVCVTDPLQVTKNNDATVDGSVRAMNEFGSEKAP